MSALLEQKYVGDSGSTNRARVSLSGEATEGLTEEVTELFAKAKEKSRSRGISKQHSRQQVRMSTDTEAGKHRACPCTRMTVA